MLKGMILTLTFKLAQDTRRWEGEVIDLQMNTDHRELSFLFYWMVPATTTIFLTLILKK